MNNHTTEKLFPLSLSQQNIWNLERSLLGTSVNNICTTVRLRGHLDFPLLQKSIHMVLEKDSSMRTRLVQTEEGVMQYHVPYEAEDFPVYDFSNTSKEGIENWEIAVTREPIPLEELGHPRIDVTLRVSGLFRDMYPNLIQRMDEAVTCVAMLDEKEEDNFIRKHINEDVRALIDDGLPPNEAAEQAQLRVFGCPSGGYGAGVANLISNQNWKDYKDLASVYETWSGNAYGRGHHGTAMQKLFKKRQ